MSRVVLAMSGGVDSSVAAHLLRRAGHEVVGVFMRHGEAEGVTCSTQSAGAERGTSALPIVHNLPRQGQPVHKQGCCSASDAQDARRVADLLDIPFYAIDMQDQFAQIIDYFIAEYTAARTPNPCVMCNNWLKFGKLFEYADAVGAHYVATGHYARLMHALSGPDDVPALCRGLDDSKDQSYVLFGIARQLLPRMLLPIGEYRKAEIRQIARDMNLPVAEKKDSQEICFVPDGDHAAFIRGQRGSADTGGEIVTTDGRVVGNHEGLEQFTIGQRKGLGVALGEPRFVVRLEHATRRVVIGSKDELARSQFSASRSNWLSCEPALPLRCQVKIRYNSRLMPAVVEALSARRLQVRLDEPQYGVAPGQAVVCYDGQRVLGGGWIE